MSNNLTTYTFYSFQCKHALKFEECMKLIVPNTIFQVYHLREKKKMVVCGLRSNQPCNHEMKENNDASNNQLSKPRNDEIKENNNASNNQVSNPTLCWIEMEGVGVEIVERLADIMKLNHITRKYLKSFRDKLLLGMIYNPNPFIGGLKNTEILKPTCHVSHIYFEQASKRRTCNVRLYACNKILEVDQCNKVMQIKRHLKFHVTGIIPPKIYIDITSKEGKVVVWFINRSCISKSIHFIGNDACIKTLYVEIRKVITDNQLMHVASNLQPM